MSSKTEFLQELRQRLHGLPVEEIENAMQYYEEYFADAGEENEQQVLKELGSPALIAAQIRADAAMRQLQTGPATTKKGISAVWLILLAFLAAPIALPMAIGVVASVLGIVITILVLLAVFCFVAVVLIICGFIVVFSSAPVMWVSVPTSLFGLGIGFACVGIGILLCVFFIQCSRWSFHGIAYLLNRFAKRKQKKEASL